MSSPRIEIEMKFRPPPDFGDKLNAADIALRSTMMLEDRYFDLCKECLPLMHADYWFRNRCGTWELKYPCLKSHQCADLPGSKYREVDGSVAVVSALREVLSRPFAGVDPPVFTLGSCCPAQSVLLAALLPTPDDCDRGTSTAAGLALLRCLTPILDVSCKRDTFDFNDPDLCGSVELVVDTVPPPACPDGGAGAATFLEIEYIGPHYASADTIGNLMQRAAGVLGLDSAHYSSHSWGKVGAVAARSPALLRHLPCIRGGGGSCKFEESCKLE